MKGTTYYMKSILEWEKEMDCYLCRHGQRPAELTLGATLEEIVFEKVENSQRNAQTT